MEMELFLRDGFAGVTRKFVRLRAVGELGEFNS